MIVYKCRDICFKENIYYYGVEVDKFVIYIQIIYIFKIWGKSIMLM